MMGLKQENDREKVSRFSLEQLVPKDHLVKKINNAIVFSFIKDKVKHLYSNRGVHSIDPTILFKIIFI